MPQRDHLRDFVLSVMMVEIQKRYSNPRTDYINDGQGIGENHSRFLERVECQ